MIQLDKISLSVMPDLISFNGNRTFINNANTRLPFFLNIAFSRRYESYKVAFSAKVLRDRYIELINRDNIRDCLNAINALGICTLDIDRVMAESLVVGADFTRDIKLEDIPANNMNEVKSIVKLSINNYDRWNCANYRHGGLVVSNAVNDRRRARRLTIYKKDVELRKRGNRDFLASLDDRDNLLAYFRDRVRFELRATTKYQLREWCDVHDLTIMNVLNSNANPLRVVMSEMFNPIFAVDEDLIKPTLTNLDKLSTLKFLEWDLTRVEAHVRESTTRSIKEGMKPYNRLYCAYKVSRSINLVDVVRE